MSTTLSTASDAKPQTLDEVMLAMDVVDTLRHQDRLVARELDDTRREAELIERLRSIYKSQGMEVPDEVIRQGVAAIKENRFVYVPPKPGLGVTFARMWIARRKVGKVVGTALLALGIGGGGWWFGVEQPKRAEIARVERDITQVLPGSLTAAHAEALAEAKSDQARARAAQLLAEGQTAIRQRNAAAGRKAITDLDELRVTLTQEYTLRIRNRPGLFSGVFRDFSRDGRRVERNYYVVVEAFDTSGRKVSLPIYNEETKKTEVVDVWGVRTTEAVLQRIGADRRDDGVIQNNRVGDKKRGELDVTYTFPVENGMITRWEERRP
jgi:hypothetical protein